MSNQSAREMTLDEWVDRLPTDHGARLELAALRALLAEAREAVNGKPGVRWPREYCPACNAGVDGETLTHRDGCVFAPDAPEDLERKVQAWKERNEPTLPTPTPVESKPLTVDGIERVVHAYAGARMAKMEVARIGWWWVEFVRTHDALRDAIRLLLAAVPMVVECFQTWPVSSRPQPEDWLRRAGRLDYQSDGPSASKDRET